MSNFHSVPNTPPPFLYFDHSPREQSPSHHIMMEDSYHYRSPPSSTSNLKQQMLGANNFQPIGNPLERSASAGSIGNSSYCFSPLPFPSIPQHQSNMHHYHGVQSIKPSHPIPLKASPRASLVHTSSSSSISSYHRQSTSPIPNPIINSTPFVKLNNNQNHNQSNSTSTSSSCNINLVSPSASPNQMPMSPVFERALIPLLNLKQCKSMDLDTSFTISPKYSSSVPTTPGDSTPNCRTPIKLPLDHSPSVLSPASSTCSSLPASPRNNNSFPSSPSSTPSSTPRAALSVPDKNGDQAYPKQAEQQWKKLEYYANEFNHFIFETLKTKEFNQIEQLNAKLSEITNTVKEIEITNNIYKSLPPQTRARKKRATKAEKLQKDLLGIKRTYVTTPKSKGNYCFFCGTMETPEWRKGPGGHKTLCNACGLHYAKNIKKESIKNSQQTQAEPSSCQSMNVSSLLEN